MRLKYEGQMGRKCGGELNVDLTVREADPCAKEWRQRFSFACASVCSDAPCSLASSEEKASLTRPQRVAYAQG